MPEDPRDSPDTLAKPDIRGFSMGMFQTNCYVVTARPNPPPGSACWIIDASFDPEELIEDVQARQLVPVAVILTHAHVDHIAGLFEVRRAFPKVPIWIHHAEREWLSDPMANLSGLHGMPITGPSPDRLLNDGDTLELDGQSWQVLHTPGHSPGGITLFNAPSSIALVGDTLFAGSIGRHDFPSSDGPTLVASIKQRLYTLPDATKVYPGHGPPTTIGREKRSNPYVRA